MGGPRLHEHGAGVEGGVVRVEVEGGKGEGGGGREGRLRVCCLEQDLSDACGLWCGRGFQSGGGGAVVGGR